MTGILRWQLFATYAVAFGAVWSVARSSSAAAWHEFLPPWWVIDYAPLWAIMGLGVYAVGSVLYGVANFRDCPEAAAEIEAQVAEAKQALRQRGVLSSSSS